MTPGDDERTRFPSAPDDDEKTLIRPRTAAPAGSGAPAQPASGLGAEDPLALFGAAAPASVPSSGRRAADPGDAAGRQADDGGQTGNALAVGTRIAEFEILGVIGEGGFGIVYLAQDHSLERQVALKEYMPSSLSMRIGNTEVQVRSERHRETFEAGRSSFVKEARLLAKFDHPSLLKVYRFWEGNGTAYMAMPLYQGPTMKQALQEMGEPPDEAWLMAILDPLSAALQVLHADNCYHRDIAPDNVMLLAGSGRPVLLDFGAARQVIGDMTQALTVILKPGYAPVEQYAEVPEMKQGAWTDIYALAATVHFALVGRTPPPSVGRLMQDSYLPLVERCADRYSERFLRAIDRALQVRPEQRTQSIEDLRVDLGLERFGSTAPQQTLMQRPGRPDAARPAVPAEGKAEGQRSPALWIGLGVGVLALAGIAFVLFGRGGKPAPADNAPAATASPPAAVAPAPSVAPPPPAENPAAAATASAPLPAAPGATAVPGPSGPGSGTLPAGPFDPMVEIDRVVTLATPGFDVKISMNKDKLKIGRDKLQFKVTSSQAGWVNLLALGPDGSLTRLLPSTTLPALPIKAGQTLVVPQIAVDTVEPVGRERLLVIVSREPRELSNFQHKDEGFVELDLREPPVANGGLPSLLGVAAACKGPSCDDYGAGHFDVEVVH